MRLFFFNSYFPLRCPKENSCGLIHTDLIKLVKEAACVYVCLPLCVVSPSPGQIYCASETNSWSQLMRQNMPSGRAVRPQPFQKTNKQNLVFTQVEVKYGQLKVLTMCSESEDFSSACSILSPGDSQNAGNIPWKQIWFFLISCLYFLLMDTEGLSC